MDLNWQIKCKMCQKKAQYVSTDFGFVCYDHYNLFNGCGNTPFKPAAQDDIVLVVEFDPDEDDCEESDVEDQMCKVDQLTPCEQGQVINGCLYVFGQAEANRICQRPILAKK